MIIKNKRSIFFLFLAMLVSSIVIGSYCQTEFKPEPQQIKPIKKMPLINSKTELEDNNNRKTPPAVHSDN